MDIISKQRYKMVLLIVHAFFFLLLSNSSVHQGETWDVMNELFTAGSYVDASMY